MGPVAADIRVVIAYGLGFFLPGYLLARRLRRDAGGSAGFILSLVVLFHGIFWTHLWGLSLSFGSVLGWELVITALAGGALWRSRKTAPVEAPRPGWDRCTQAVAVVCALLVVAMALRSTLAPLTGPDVVPRWDLLPRQMLATGTFSFYPPVTPEDFRHYAYVESQPPVVGFAYWWIYAALGRAEPMWTGLFVAAQYAATLVLTWRLARALSTSHGGALAAVALASSGLVYWATAMGQETGLTSLAVVATLWFVVSSSGRDDWRSAALAGAAAGLGCLTREYGPAIVVIGFVACRWRRLGWRAIGAYLLVATVIGAPWYVRTWIVTGNPFYSTPAGGLFPENKVWVGVHRSYAEQQGVTKINAEKWAWVRAFLWRMMPVQVVLGVPAVVLLVRRNGYLAIATAIAIAIWAASVGMTAGLIMSLRVLAPAAVVLSVAGGVVLDRWLKGRFLRGVAGAVLIALGVWNVAWAFIFPYRLTPMSPVRWLALASSRPPVAQGADAALAAEADRLLPPGVRILSSDAYAHARMIGSEHEIVMPWSPEVGFVVSPTEDPQEIERRLRALRIGAVWHAHGGLIDPYLLGKPFYREGIPRWKVLARIGERGVLYALPEGATTRSSP